MVHRGVEGCDEIKIREQKIGKWIHQIHSCIGINKNGRDRGVSASSLHLCQVRQVSSALPALCFSSQVVPLGPDPRGSSLPF